MAARAPTGPAPATTALLCVARLSTVRGLTYHVMYVGAPCKHLELLYRIHDRSRAKHITLCMSFSKSLDKPLGRVGGLVMRLLTKRYGVSLRKTNQPGISIGQAGRHFNAESSNRHKVLRKSHQQTSRLKTQRMRSNNCQHEPVQLACQAQGSLGLSEKLVDLTKTSFRYGIGIESTDDDFTIACLGIHT